MKNKREGWLLKWRDLVTPADPAVITSANDAQRKGGAHHPTNTDPRLLPGLRTNQILLRYL